MVSAGHFVNRGAMDIKKIIAELHTDRQNIDQAINALEHVGGRKRRGRPPKWMSQAAPEKRPLAERKKKAVEKANHSREFEASRSPNRVSG
jgi:hypothetical protein